jgi:hypothetical protein
MLTLEELEARHTPATLDIVAGALSFVNGPGETSTVTVSVASGVYTVKDAGAAVTLGAGAVAAGWRGSGTNTASGTAAPVDSLGFDLDDGTLNVRSVADPIVVGGGTGAVQVNVNSTAPTGGGSLNGIAAAVTVNAGANTSLWVSDLTGILRPHAINVTATGITGLAQHPITLGGTFAALRVTGSTFLGLDEVYVIDAPPCLHFRLDTGGGDDAVTVLSDLTGDLFGGAGADTLTFAPGVVFTGTYTGFETVAGP